MPIYEYVCSKCKTEFESRLSFSEFDLPQVCPKCHSTAQKLISSFSTRNAGKVEIAEKPFRKETAKAPKPESPVVLITPPPGRIELLSPPANKTIRPRRKKK